MCFRGQRMSGSFLDVYVCTIDARALFFVDAPLLLDARALFFADGPL